MADKLQSIKDEFKKDGQVIESAFRIEFLIRKYKKQLIALGVVLLALIAYYVCAPIYKNHKIQKAREAYFNLSIENSDKDELLKTIKSNNPLLYDFLSFIKKDRKDEGLLSSKYSFIKVLTSYEKIQLNIDELMKNDHNSLEAIETAFKDFDAGDDTSLRDFVNLQKGFVLLSNNYIDEAKRVIEQISVDSSIYPLTTPIKHYK